MRKIKKIALALLYLTQILVICREPAAKVFEGFHETGEQEITPAETIRDLREIFSRAWHNQIDAYRTSLMRTLPHRGPLAGEAIEHVRHPHEEKKSEQAKRHRRRMFKEYVIDNLWLAIQRLALPESQPQPIFRPLTLHHAALSAA
ncbi:MAG: hypothetical protein WCT10_03100 [Patescibacteria group bacterium]|jgi:hypothetical protein